MDARLASMPPSQRQQYVELVTEQATLAQVREAARTGTLLLARA